MCGRCCAIRLATPHVGRIPARRLPSEQIHRLDTEPAAREVDDDPEVLPPVASSRVHIAADHFFGEAICAFHADRCTHSCLLTKSTSLHSSATISPSRNPASPASNTRMYMRA